MPNPFSQPVLNRALGLQIQEIGAVHREQRHHQQADQERIRTQQVEEATGEGASFVQGNADDRVPDGNTDPNIFREIISNHRLGLRDDTANFVELTQRYAHHLKEEMRLSEQAFLMPGVGPLLKLLHKREDLALGLLTGNFETTARIKLDRFDLNRFFPFGAFGSDHALRERLVPIAVERAEAALGRPIGLGRHVVVIGDTPRDVECALAHGATAIGVAASHYSVDELSSAGAHTAMSSLEDIDGFMTSLG